MSDELYQFTAADVALVKELVQAHRSRRLPLRSRTEDLDHQAPEVYVAKLPIDGIPARIDTVLGSADCIVYSVVDDEIFATTMTKTVYNTSLSIASDAYNIIVRDKFGRWLVVVGGGSRDSYIVKLTGSGTGIDSGTAWKGLIQKVVGGGVIDNGEIGPVENRYVMYATKAADGSLGNPEIGDIVVAVLDPLLAGRWEFIPKSARDGDNGGCGFLLDVLKSACFGISAWGGYGRCFCVPADPFDLDDPTVRVNHPMIWVDALGGWLSTAMASTCCGCGGALFKITNPAAMEVSLTLINMHVSCVTGSGGAALFDLELTHVGCFIDAQGRTYIKFVGSGPDACDGVPSNCNNIFEFRVYCGDCPDPICDCCCLNESPPAWYFDLPLGNEYANNELNGMWVLSFLADEANCTWESIECNGHTARLEYIPSVAKFRLTHGGGVFEVAIAGWECGGSNSMPKVSGTGPASIAILPIMVETDPLLTQPCDLPDELTMSYSSVLCPIMNGSKTLTRLSPTEWTFLDPIGSGASGVISAGVSCVNNQWVAGLNAQCGRTAPDPDETYDAITSVRPDSQEYGPLELVWTGVAITGTDPSPVGACCNVATDLIITITE